MAPVVLALACVSSSTVQGRSYCFTVDVEDWHDGMSRRGHELPRRAFPEDGLESLAIRLEPRPDRLTFFVVGQWARRVSPLLRDLLAAGHEIASHGPEHGEMPTVPEQLVGWLRRGRETVEEQIGFAVRGFRPPNFAKPHGMAWSTFREAIAEAGFAYVSDRRAQGAPQLAELPIAEYVRVPLGGGSYQRLLPRPLLRAAGAHLGEPAVFYYHSYDFGFEVPSVFRASPRLLSQTLARGRVATAFWQLLDRFGSRSCGDVVHVR